jgi:predicted AlkP superfamily phosphohydrolase/phosphomutase
MKQLVIIGLDCATPQLVFDAWRDELPNLARLMQEGVWGPMTSTIPPITVPAWTCMMTSQDPGMLGIYGFRNRSAYGYDDLYFANANYVKAPTVWNHLSRNRMKSLVFGVPQTYPPKPLNGAMVSCFLTPNKQVNYTYPAEMKTELEEVADGDYIFDLDNFRTDDKSELLGAIYKMSQRRFRAFRHFLAKDSYDFAMMVEMGIDRIHHGFWRYIDKTHRLYEPGNPYENAMLDYYKEIDREVGETLKILTPETSVLVVSDHGAKPMQGAICINEWLMKEGYLALKEPPAKRMRMTMEMVDWSKTIAWGEGGYYCRLFMNVEGREPQGTVPKDKYEAVRDEIKAKLEAMCDEEGKPLGTRALKPEDTYHQTNGIPPDLTVYLGDLDWRSSGSVGVGSVYMYENDTGPDDANHAQEGIFIARMAGDKQIEKRDKYSIYDIAPTLLSFYDLEIPAEMIGHSLLGEE